MSQQGFRTLNDNVFVYQELTAGTSIAYGLDTSSNLIKIKAQSTIGATPTGTAQITIDPVAAGNITITPNVTGRTVISSNLTVSAGTVVITPLASARPCTVRSSTLGQLSTLIDSNVNGQLLISSAAGTPIWASLTAGAGMTITPGANSITLSAPGGGLPVGLTGEVLIGVTGLPPVFSANPTVTSILATTFDTNVAAAAVTLSGTTLSADGTDANINISITAKGSGQVIIDDLQLTTDLAVTEGGTGVSTLTDHGLLVGSGTAAIDALAVGATGVILTGVTGADPTWTTATYPATIAKGEIVCATDANVIGVVTGTGVAGQVLTSTGAASVPTWQAATGGIGTLAGDSGTATGATVTIAGGTNLTSAAAGATVTLNLDAAITAMTSVDFASGGRIGTGLVNGNTLLLQAYNVNGASYTTFATLTADTTTPTMDLASTVTIASNYIYRAGGTDVSVADGGTGASTLLIHGLLVGNTTSALNSVAVGSTGTILTGVTGADPTWTTATYPATTAIGDVLVASANNVIGVVAGATTAGHVLTANGAGTAPTFQAASGGGIGTLAGDSGTATGATVTIAGGTNLTSVAGTATLTLNLDAALSGTTSHVFANTGYLGTGTTAADTLLIQAYDVDGTAYVPFITLTANNTPTMDIASAATIGSAYIYRASGTDVAVADGGTGASTLTQNGVVYGNAASAVGITAEGSTGTILVGTTGNAPSWLATGTEGKVLTSHNGSALTWETPSAGGGLTWSIVTSDLNPMVVDNGYIANKAGLLTFTLPTTCAVGKVLRVTGMNTALGWKIAQSANQIIHFGTSTTTTGAGGYISSVNIHDSVELVCIVADLEFVVVSSTGNITIA